MSTQETSRRNPAAGPPGSGRRALGGMLVVVSLFVLFFAFLSHRDIGDYDPNGPTMCGEDVMTPRDRCMFGAGDGSYEAQKAEAEKQHDIDLMIRDIGFVAGPALFVAGVLLMVWGTRRIRATQQPAEA
ncbi:hypothetical protein [Micromonospora chalcea]|uniref:hypothetical protein n=1 Tax=Micromonospora chalcea TaxID=1874 RepID=UPI0021A82ADA|nr:hypothetical protein [Micromonospora chalcea]MCT2277579.1 hypothetical protein [Micromonospora chalcea]